MALMCMRVYRGACIHVKMRGRNIQQTSKTHTHAHTHEHMHLQGARTSKRRWTRPSWINSVAAGATYLSSCVSLRGASPPVTSPMSPSTLRARAHVARVRLRFKKELHCDAPLRLRGACLTALIWVGMRRPNHEWPPSLPHTGSTSL